MYRPASRTRDIAPFHVMELLSRARALEAAGRDIVHMEVGEPDFPTPDPILRAGHAALDERRTFYTAALGLPELRQAITDFYASRYGLAVPASRIVVTAGASGALNLALACLCEPGREWLVSDPGYPCNRHFVSAAMGRARLLPTTATDRFQLSAAQVREAIAERLGARACRALPGATELTIEANFRRTGLPDVAPTRHVVLAAHTCTEEAR